MYGFTLIFILAFIGGVIAYFGDKIGMKIGRKRLTIFGLRPKYTSIIITVFTGIFIAAASIIVLSFASEDVRTALFEMREIQETLATNQQQLATSMEIMEDMEASLNSIIAERDQVESNLFNVRVQLEEVQQQYDILVGDLEVAKTELVAEREQVEQYREVVAELEDRRDRLVEELNVLWATMGRVRLSNVVFGADEIIYDQVIEGGGSIESIGSELIEILNRADQIAYQLGARVDNDSQLALIIDQAVFDFVVHAIHQQQGLAVVRVVSETNTVSGEPVFAYFELIPNEILFTADTVLAEVSVDLDIILEVDKPIWMLLDKANAFAVNAGMVTNNNRAVEVLGEDLLDVIEQAGELSGPITIQAVVVEDTFAAVGPLRVKLEIK